MIADARTVYSSQNNRSYGRNRIDALFEVGLNAFFFNLIFILHPLFSDVIQMLGKYFGKKDHKMFPLELVVELS